MPERPLLPIPTPTSISVPPGLRVIPSLRGPSRQRQGERFEPVFSRLRNLIARPEGRLQLREDPSSLAPDRVIVFEIADTVDEFVRAVSRIQGLEFMAEYEDDFAADENFAIEDRRVGKEGQLRTDKIIPGRLYLAMPDVRALEELLSLWERWQRGEALGNGFAPFGRLFAQLRSLRPWGPEDRIPEDTLTFWQEETETQPDRPIRTEIEIWYWDSQARRTQASQTVRGIVAEVGGEVMDEAIISEIAYHGMLVDIPANVVQNLISERTVKLALADDVMFLRPQSLLRGPLEIETEAAIPGPPAQPPATGSPIAALLDGVPLQAHVLLQDRTMLDDPDDLQSRALVSQRRHGTAMASLILHGDRNDNAPPLPRPLYVRPVIVPNAQGSEYSEANRLIVDTIYRAILRIKGTEGQEGVAPTVFLINLSMGDTRRPFTRIISPLARLLDFLSARYNILFLVSGGNIGGPLDIPEFNDWTSFGSATPQDRQKAVLKALNTAKFERSILSPAESLNALTIGAQHYDNVAVRVGLQNAIDPFNDNTLPNVSSALGLGHRRMIKPDLYFPGGREHVLFQSSGGGLTIKLGVPRKLYGLSAAAPDTQGQGRLDQVALSDGTSSATALATRAGHRIFDSLMDRDGGSLLADIDPEFYAVVVKALMVHSAKWNAENEELLKEICGPADRRRHIERGENTSRFIGFGVPTIEDALECAANRATLVGSGKLRPDTAANFRIPLPACLERVTEPRFLTVTVAWFSPVKPGHQRYRCVRLEASPVQKPIEVLGVERSKSQAADPTVKRGSVFHERFEGESAIPFIDDGHLSLRVWCKEDAGIANEEIRYGIAVTIGAGTELPVYSEIQTRLRIRPRL